MRVAIAGSGFGGLGAAIRLKKARVDDFVVLERADDIGGTWRDNTYPGCVCDVPSRLYSFSFAPNPGWTRAFSPQPEILAYLRRCAQRFGIGPHLRFGTEVRAAAWDGDRLRWRLETSRGVLTADAFVAAVGPLSEPAVPRLPGIETFAGTTFHSARWDWDYDLRGRRVAVIGTGASSAQFVPRIQPVVAALDVYQRTPPWVVPRRDRAVNRLERRAYSAAPPLSALARAGVYAGREVLIAGLLSQRVARLNARLALRNLEKSVPDPGLRAKLTPRYAMGCKRIVVSSDYLPSLGHANVDVVTEPITSVRPRSVVTADGAERATDAIIYGTGFRVTDLPIAERVRGRDGRTLAQVWRGSPQAYLGTTVAGFPNLFLLLGPNTGLGHTSVVIMIEAQIGHVLAALRFLAAHGYAALAPRPDVQAAYVAEVDAKMHGTVWQSGCATWYIDRTGRNSTLWPRTTWAFRRRTARFRPDDYELSRAT